MEELLHPDRFGLRLKANFGYSVGREKSCLIGGHKECLRGTHPGEKMSADPAVTVEIVEEDLLRARVYRLLARLLRTKPDTATLATLTNLSGDDTPLGQALGTLARVAGKVTEDPIQWNVRELSLAFKMGEGI